MVKVNGESDVARRSYKDKKCRSEKLDVTNRELSDDERELGLELTCEEYGEARIVICKVKDEEDES